MGDFRRDVWEGSCDQQQHRNPGRHVEQEYPCPGQGVGDETAQGGSDDRSDAPYKADQALKPATFLRWKQVGDSHKAGGHDDSASEALDGTEPDKLDHGLAQAGRNRTYHEDGDSQEEEDPASVEIGKPAHDRDRNRGRDHVGGRSPRITVESPQVGDDTGHRRGDDGLAQRGQEHRQQDSGQRYKKLFSGKRNEITCARLIGRGFGIGVAVHEHLLCQRSFRRQVLFP